MNGPRDPDVYRSIRSGPAVEIRVKGSRFAAVAIAVAADGEARAHVDRLRRRDHDATHHCSAYRIGPPGDVRERFDDDGEPSSTAGKPILAAIEGREIHDALVVVTRWFGGTKLGAGGLVRAYGGCAGETLDRARLVPWVQRVTVIVRYPWSDSGLVDGVLRSRGIEPDETLYDAAVHVKVALPIETARDLEIALRDASSGRIKAEIS